MVNPEILFLLLPIGTHFPESYTHHDAGVRACRGRRPPSRRPIKFGVVPPPPPYIPGAPTNYGLVPSPPPSIADTEAAALAAPLGHGEG
jgi:hypothetical protein